MRWEWIWPEGPTGRLSRLLALGALLSLAAFLSAAGFATQGAFGGPDRWTALADLSTRVWAPVLVGLGAWAAGAWLIVIAPGHLAARLFAASGVCTFLFTHAAAIVSAQRSVGGTAVWAETVNMFSAAGFGVLIIAVLLLHPRPLPLARVWIGAAALVFMSWTALKALGPDRHYPAIQQITLVEMLTIVAVAGLQVAVNLKDAQRLRAALWIAGSVILGAGPFIGLVALPISLGGRSIVNSNNAFVFFLILYAGLAVGIARLRLFDLGPWTLRVLGLGAAFLTVMVIDLLLIAALRASPGPALATAVAVVAVGYGPVRELIARRFLRDRRLDGQRLVEAVARVAFQPSAEARGAAWRSLLLQTFDPLEVRAAASPAQAPSVEHQGAALTVPGLNPDDEAVVLTHADGGRRRFGPRDAGLAANMVALLRALDDRRMSYDEGVAAERLRLARDLHDNVGGQLMRALHVEEPGRKNVMIRETLSDIRDLINDIARVGSADQQLADLRLECLERLEAGGVSAEWLAEGVLDGRLSPRDIQALRGLLREAVSNILKHAQARRAIIRLAPSDDTLLLEVSDDGRGFGGETPAREGGLGLASMRARAGALDGDIDLGMSDLGGARLSVRLPCGQARRRAA
ncbi:MAG: sensor histidine kinase [Brevundimonas sp.]